MKKFEFLKKVTNSGMAGTIAACTQKATIEAVKKFCCNAGKRSFQ
jgi:hypothetical protein